MFGILLVRTSSDVDKYRNLIDEATFYDKQWSATWDGQSRPATTERRAAAMPTRPVCAACHVLLPFGLLPLLSARSLLSVLGPQKTRI